MATRMSGKGGNPERSDRAKRLSAALRQNLKRRKDQSRARADEAGAGAIETPVAKESRDGGVE